MNVFEKIHGILRPKRLPGMFETNRPHSNRTAKKIVQNYIASTDKPSLHFGCGENNFRGWLNIDIGGKPDIFCDFMKPLGFLPPESFQYSFSEHVLEHFQRKTTFLLAKTIWQSLVPGGVLRVAVPDLDRVINQYLSYDKEKFEHIQSEFAAEYGEAYYTRGEYLDICMRAWGHRYLFNEEDITLLLQRAGFNRVRRVEYHKSEHPFLRGIEVRSPQQSSLIVEATK